MRGKAAKKLRMLAAELYGAKNKPARRFVLKQWKEMPRPKRSLAMIQQAIMAVRDGRSKVAAEALSSELAPGG